MFILIMTLTLTIFRILKVLSKKEGAGGLYDEIASVYNRNSQINIDIKDI